MSRHLERRLEALEAAMMTSACGCPPITVAVGSKDVRAAQARVRACPARHRAGEVGGPQVIEITRFASRLERVRQAADRAMQLDGHAAQPGDTRYQVDFDSALKHHRAPLHTSHNGGC